MTESTTLGRAKRKYGMRKGMSLLEMSLVLIVALAFIGGAYYAYKKIYPSVQATSEFRKITGVVSAIDRMKQTNGGYYIAIDTETVLPSVDILKDELGGSGGNTDVAKWQYKCPEGDDSTVTVLTDDIPNETIRNLVVQKVNSNLPGWTASVSGSQVKIEKSDSICKP